MCLIAFNWNPNHETPFVIAANRDEFYARPSLAACWWQLPGWRNLLAGQDLQAGGTWLGVTRSGRFAALTNYRDPKKFRKDAQSRGDLVKNFLHDKMSINAQCYLEKISTEQTLYNDFNLLLYDGQNLLGYESRHAKIIQFQTGIHTVSNADFDTPWPKAECLRTTMPDILNNHEALLEMLANQKQSRDNELPSTGISLEREKALSAVFVQTPDYGTRASTVVHIGQHSVALTERSFGPQKPAEATLQFTFERQKTAA